LVERLWNLKNAYSGEAKATANSKNWKRDSQGLAERFK